MMKRLQTVLAHAGYASRRSSAEIILSGRVTVDGKIVTEKGVKVNPEIQEIKVDGQLLSKEEKKYYFLFNKPKGVISSAKDTHGRTIVTDFFKAFPVRLYPVGRLDKDTTGALIVTNDGDFAHKLSHPSFEINKEYIAVTNKQLKKYEVAELEDGIVIAGKKTSPCQIELLDLKGIKAVYKVIIHEGKKRQIRIMFTEKGARVLELERTIFAGIKLGKLIRGGFRKLRESEILSLQKLIRK